MSGEWRRVGVRRARSSGSPRENGYIESFNGKPWGELLDGKLFQTLKDTQVFIERWRRHYNTVRPHSSLGWLTPAEFRQ